MAPYFEERLVELLPPLYRVEDGTGDLAAILKVPAASLDEFKELIARFPDIFDVDRSAPRYLPHLAHLVGLPHDGGIVPEAQRDRIREAVPRYRRKGSIPAIQRSLAEIGWEGAIEETFASALRLDGGRCHAGGLAGGQRPAAQVKGFSFHQGKHGAPLLGADHEAAFPIAVARLVVHLGGAGFDSHPVGDEGPGGPALAPFAAPRNAASALVSACCQRGASPLRFYPIGIVADRNCVAARRGGEQRKAKEQSVG